jgi:hypothetical protein
MAGVIDTLISGIVKSAMDEILKKTGLKPAATKRTKRKTKTPAKPTTSAAKRKAGSVSGSSGSGARSTTAKKQVSKRRTSTARSKQRA